MSAKKPYSICTALLTVMGDWWTESDSKRLKLLQKILTEAEPSDIILLPGGYFSSSRSKSSYIKWVDVQVTSLIKELVPRSVLVFGIDVRFPKGSTNKKDHELAIAVSKAGIKAVARKFDGGSDLQLASSAWEKEENYPRTFKKKDRKYYLAVCNDIFGLKNQDVENKENIDAVLNTIHCFTERGKKGCGDTYFARHGLAGAAKHWRCPVFGAAHYLNRPIPPKWPSGVKWKRGLELSTNIWTYQDNSIKPSETSELSENGFVFRYFRF